LFGFGFFGLNLELLFITVSLLLGLSVDLLLWGLRWPRDVSGLRISEVRRFSIIVAIVIIVVVPLVE